MPGTTLAHRRERESRSGGLAKREMTLTAHVPLRLLSDTCQAFSCAGVEALFDQD